MFTGFYNIIILLLLYKSVRSCSENPFIKNNSKNTLLHFL